MGLFIERGMNWELKNKKTHAKIGRPLVKNWEKIGEKLMKTSTTTTISFAKIGTRMMEMEKAKTTSRREKWRIVDHLAFWRFLGKFLKFGIGLNEVSRAGSWFLLDRETWKEDTICLIKAGIEIILRVFRGRGAGVRRGREGTSTATVTVTATTTMEADSTGEEGEAMQEWCLQKEGTGTSSAMVQTCRLRVLFLCPGNARKQDRGFFSSTGRKREKKGKKGKREKRDTSPFSFSLLHPYTRKRIKMCHVDFT